MPKLKERSKPLPGVHEFSENIEGTHVGLSGSGSHTPSSEYILMGIGFLLFAFSALFWLVIFSIPFIFAYWYAIRPLLSHWTPINTFGALIALGLISFIYLIATWGK